MRKAAVYPLFALAVMLAGLVAGGCGDDNDNGAVSATTNSRPWLDELEFLRDPTLHAVPGQTVILHLGSAQPGAGLVEHTIRYMVKNTVDLTFCMLPDEPYLRNLDLVVEPSGEVMVHREPGSDCVSVTIPAGTYVLHISHDGTNVPPQGVLAFLHHPQSLASSGARAQVAAGSGASLTSFAVPDFMAFKYGSSFVTDATASPLLALESVGTSVDAHAVFRFSAAGSKKYGMKDGTGAAVKTQNATCAVSGPLLVGDAGESSAAQTFEFSDNGNNQFGFCVAATFCGGDVACIFRDSTTNVLNYNDNGKAGTTFTVDYKGYDCATTCDSSTLTLQQGEVALFGKENYGGPAYVFHADVPSFIVYNSAASNGLAMGNDEVASVRVGPNTLVVLYKDVNYGGSSVVVAGDTPSLAGTPVGNAAVSSMHVNQTDISQYILESKGCENCVLTGVDLSGLDLTGLDFAGARLSGANLSGTVLQEANLDGATLSGAGTELSGADFSYANLQCADLSEADLTGATFGSLTGKLLVVDQSPAGILKTDPISGDRVLISGGPIGSGTDFDQPDSVALNADGTTLIVADELLPGVFSVDPSTGNRTVVSSRTVGSGSNFVAPVDVTIDSSGDLLVVDRAQMVFRVNPSNGARTIVSGGGKGSGTAFVEPVGIAIDHSGRLIVADRGLKAVLAVDPSSGARTVLSGDGTGTGTSFFTPVDVAVDSHGKLIVADLTLTGVFEVDPDSGARTVLSGAGTGSGPSFNNVASVALAGDGTVFATDQILGLVRVDLPSGARTVISDETTGTGPGNSAPAGLVMTPTLALDFSCRLNANGATIDAAADAETFPPGYWRYLDLTGADILNATAATLSTADDPLDLSGALLNGAGLTGAVLDGVNLDCATPSETDEHCSQLIGTVLNQASMKGASAVNAALNGAKLIRANLEQANLSGAQLLKSPTTSASAILDGAYLKNANLSQADLSGASLINVDWYSSGTGLCDGGGWTGTCASGTGSTKLSNADFSGAYLAGLDLSGATVQQADFRGAILAGAHFNNANLSGDPNTGALTHFNGAFLQGANFDSANTTGADFTDAYFDLQSPSGLEIIWQLPDQNLQFTGYTPPATPPECVLYSTNGQTTTPTYAPGYTCPDGSDSPCPDEVWQCDTCVPDSSSTPPASIDGSYPGTCTRLDFKW